MLRTVFITLMFFVASGTDGLAYTRIPDVVHSALKQSFNLPGARFIPINFLNPKDCEIQSALVTQPILGSGRVPVRYSGRHCTGLAWAEVKVWVDMAVTIRPVAKGQPLAGSIRRVEFEVRRGQLPFWPRDEAVASRPLLSGVRITERDVDGINRESGSHVKVVVTNGSLAVTTEGRRIACGHGRMCAVLPSGKRVEGSLDEADRLIVEMP